MIRFYCRECKCVKRVNVMPVTVLNPSHPDPTMRVGECRWHVAKLSGKVSHRAFLGHKPTPQARIQRAYAAPTPPKKARKSRPPGGKFTESAA